MNNNLADSANSEIDRIKNKVLNFKDEFRIKVRFNDTDAMGVVHFKNYMIYFDDGFVSFMRNLGLTKQFEKIVVDGTTFGVKKVNILYHDSAQFGDFINVKTFVKKIGNTTLTFDHQLYREKDDRLLASVESVRFLMNMNTKMLISAMDFFSEYLAP